VGDDDDGGGLGVDRNSRKLYGNQDWEIHSNSVNPFSRIRVFFMGVVDQHRQWFCFWYGLNQIHAWGFVNL